MNFRMTSMFLLVPCIAACGDDNSIGKDACLGDDTRCEVPELSEQTGSPMGESLRTSGLEMLSPAQSNVIAFLSPFYVQQTFPAFGTLAGSSDGTIWHLRPSEDGRALEAHVLSADGTVLETASISVTDALDTPAPYMIDARLLRAGREATTVATQSGPAPIVQPIWTTCEPDGAEGPRGCSGVVGNAIAFQRDVDDAPVRLPIPDRLKDSSLLYSQTSDGALWVFRNRILEKYDARGVLVAQQDAVKASYYKSRDAERPLPTNVPSMVALPGGGVSLVSTATAQFYEAESAELWIFDANANPTHRIQLGETSYAEPLAMAVDDQGLLTLLSITSDGDLGVARFDGITGEARTHDLLMREDYSSLYPGSMTRDVAGNIYFLLSTGGRYEPMPTLCSVAVDGGIRCFLVPELTGQTIVGAEAGVVYSEITPDLRNFADGNDTVPREVVLQRFELPLDADTLPVFDPSSPPNRSRP